MNTDIMFFMQAASCE